MSRCLFLFNLSWLVFSEFGVWSLVVENDFCVSSGI